MSSMLTQFEDGTAPKTNSNSNSQLRQDPASYSMHEPIPSYSEAIEEAQSQDANNANTNTNAIPAPTPSIEEPPSYTLLDSTQTTFTIFGTFIHTPAGPAYQLSSPLDQRGPYFRIRRLRAKEVAQVGVSPLAFDRSNLLYEVNDPPLLENEYHMQGKRRTCLPGVIVMKFRIQRWHIKHVPRPGAEKKEILTCKKVGAFGRTKLNKSREMEASEWKDAQGQVLATEMFKIMENGEVVPTVELREGLDQTWRELLLSLWATRLWVAYGNQKTAVQGGRYGQVRFAKYAGSGIVAGGSAGVGLTVIGLSGAGGI